MRIEVSLKGTVQQLATLKGEEAKRFSEWFNNPKSTKRCRFGLVSYSKDRLKVSN
jgi:hypothetical protein